MYIAYVGSRPQNLQRAKDQTCALPQVFQTVTKTRIYRLVNKTGLICRTTSA